MSSAAAALLDQLMGRSRNAVVGEDVSKDHWSDPEVCYNPNLCILKFLVDLHYKYLIIYLLCSRYASIFCVVSVHLSYSQIQDPILVIFILKKAYKKGGGVAEGIGLNLVYIACF